ncbi:Hypothetical predicted protein [Cloeon dipterum]|uniref:Uncharacterized protein n=1 Tax=Cloeon dipterum TaxID=197152 RepID=A0A8S1D1Y1_9INSE|nr:Hypothetical predicted protein [Cloeon dipterum]
MVDGLGGPRPTATDGLPAFGSSQPPIMRNHRNSAVKQMPKTSSGKYGHTCLSEIRSSGVVNFTPALVSISQKSPRE